MRSGRVFSLDLSPLAPVTLSQDDSPSRGASLDAFTRLLRSNGVFALSEICKGVVIVGVGDFATADAVGELVSGAMPSATPFIAAFAAKRR